MLTTGDDAAGGDADTAGGAEGGAAKLMFTTGDAGAADGDGGDAGVAKNGGVGDARAGGVGDDGGGAGVAKGDGGGSSADVAERGGADGGAGS